MKFLSSAQQLSVFSIYRGNVYINLGFLFFSNSCILTRCKFTKPLPAHKHTNKAKTRGWQPKTQEWGILTITEYEVESHWWLKNASKAPMSVMKKSRRIFICTKRTWDIVWSQTTSRSPNPQPKSWLWGSVSVWLRKEFHKEMTGQMLHLFKSNQNKPENGCGNNLAGLLHKVSEHHLHHEWAVTGYHYSHWIHQFSIVGIGPKNKKYVLKIRNKIDFNDRRMV